MYMYTIVSCCRK